MGLKTARRVIGHRAGNSVHTEGKQMRGAVKTTSATTSVLVCEWSNEHVGND